MSYTKVNGVLVYGEVEENAVAQAQNCARFFSQVAIQADGHKGYATPIGGVVADDKYISPAIVGYDIGCGNKAVLLNVDGDDVRKNIKTIMDDIWRTLSFGVGLNNSEYVDHALFDDPAWRMEPLRSLKDLARGQLGTIGSGNHYCDVLIDNDTSCAWVGVHFGSRGLGHKIATHFLKQCDAKDGMDVDPVVIAADSELGQDYITCMQIAGRYAYAGRDWVCQRVAELLGASILEEVSNHHNYAWKETHNGRDMWVMRKGATPAFPGQQCFVGGSMGDSAFILEGVESEESAANLYSTVHGAGRVIGRRDAVGVIKNGVVKREGKVTREMMYAWVKDFGVELRGAGCDESPHCYKRIHDVLAHHSNTVRILHELTPIGVAMAGADVIDPFKD